MLGYVFAIHDQRPDFALANSLSNRLDSGTHRISGDAGELGPEAIGIPIRIQQKLIAFACARDRIGHSAKLGCEFADQIKFFVCLAGRSDNCSTPLRHFLQAVRQGIQCLRQIRRDSGASAGRHFHPRQAVLAINPTIVETAVIAHPGGVDAVVLTRLITEDFLLA
ncbi:hypothetical protein SDC9_131846 [bioreactor metagenome]|uniref:Uncharacterized protein n=1 Tax=bioreactor metagenome TaxID=1076179 RepID=A0A645D5J6_9ZZZZ